MTRELVATGSTLLSTRITTATKDKDATPSRIIATVMIAILVPDRVQSNTIPSSANRVARVLVRSQIPKGTSEPVTPSSWRVKETFSFHETSYIRIASIPVCTVILIRNTRILWSARPHRSADVSWSTTA